MNVTLKRIPVALILLGAAAAWSDSLLMENGKIVDGIVQESSNGTLIIRTLTSQLSIPKVSIQEHLQESESEYYLRMTAEALKEDKLSQADELHKLALTFDAESDWSQALGEEIRKRNKMLEHEGRAVYEEYLEKQRLLDRAQELRHQGERNGALELLLRYNSIDSTNLDVLLEIARIYQEKTVEDFNLVASRQEEYEELAQSTQIQEDIQFVNSSLHRDLQVAREAQEIIAPLSVFHKLPYSVAVLREIHRENPDLHRMLFYLERILAIEEQPGKEPVLISQPSLRQWMILMRLTRRQEIAFEQRQHNLTTAEAGKLRKEMEEEWRKNREAEIKRLRGKISRLAVLHQYGSELLDTIRYFKQLNPPQPMLDEIAEIEKTAEEHNQQLRQFYKATGSM
ncbi:hypothetical protein JXA32_06885 [Candidatus Sumerlaeota bacterium]|nr:hypothetical protein [Candidatus Sumerlaeota bacterium]